MVLTGGAVDARLIQLFSGEFHDGFGLAVDVEFFVDALDVGANGAEADTKFAGNLFVRLAAGEPLQDFQFAGGEGVGLGAYGGLTMK